MKMKGNIFILSLLMVVCALATIHLPSTPARAEIVEMCEVGVKACRALRKLPDKFKKCMRIICADQERIIEEKKKEITQCTVGYQRCNPLRDEALYYWTCVHDTCENPPKSTEQSCRLGHHNCKVGLTQYWLCMSNTCNSTYNMYQTCEKGTEQCAPDLEDYWECVTGVCLGDPYKYRNPAFYQNNRKKTNPVYRFLRENDIDTRPPNYSAPPLRGVPEKYRFAPEGINPYDWLAATPAPTRQLNGSTSANFECKTPTASIYCGDSDMSSCQCSDGSMLSLRRTLDQKIDDGKNSPKSTTPRVLNSTYNKPVNKSLNAPVNRPNTLNKK